MCTRACVRFVLTVAVVCLVQDASSAQHQGRLVKRDIMFPNYNEPPSYYQHHGHNRAPMRGPHKHGHSHGHVYDTPETQLPKEIPFDFLMRLNEVGDISDFLKYVTVSENLTQIVDIDIVNRFGEPVGDSGVDDERKSAITPKYAKCMPEDKTVTLQPESPDPSKFYYPSCTRVKRCGGCCNSASMSCQPSETEVVTYKVHVTQYIGNNQLKSLGTQAVTVEQHNKCQCQCITKAKDCNQFQEYRPSECRCSCINVDEREKCFADNATKLWDANTCACMCREVQDCTTGSVFNPRTCRCTSLQDKFTRRHVGNIDLESRFRRFDEGKTKFQQPRPVVPLH